MVSFYNPANIFLWSALLQEVTAENAAKPSNIENLKAGIFNSPFYFHNISLVECKSVTPQILAQDVLPYMTTMGIMPFSGRTQPNPWILT